MRRFLWRSSLRVAYSSSAACNRTQPAPAAQFRPTATIKDIMDSMVDPSADTLWESVATIVSAAGTEERRPKTDEDGRTCGATPSGSSKRPTC